MYNSRKILILTVLSLVVLVTGLTAVSPAAAQTDDVPRLTVLAPTLKIRSGPDASYPAFETLVQGTTTGIIGHNPKTGWWQVVSSFGSPGWVSGNEADVAVNEAAIRQFVAAAPPPAAPATLPLPTAPLTGTGTLVFQTSSGGQIYAVNPDGSNLHYLTNGMDPALSPDGQQVAFIRWDGAEFGALFTINLDGSGERAIMGGTRQAKSPTWSADGQQIIVSFQHGGLRDPDEICKEFDSDDGVRLPGNIAEITKSRRGNDGSLVICYILKEDLQWSLRRVDVATGQFEDLPHDLYSISPTWDPLNPQRVVYDGSRGLVSLDLSQGTNWQMTEEIQDSTPVFSPDGSKIAVTYRQDGQHGDIQVLSSDGSGRMRLTQTSYMDLVQQELTGEAPNSHNNVSPAWSPDGSQIAFFTDRTGQWEIWVMNADGTNQRPLFSPDILTGITFEYNGMNERMLSWR